jgi:hypothetical protein
VPEDEFESYVWPVYKMLIDGAAGEEIAGHLRIIANDHIMCPVPEDRIQSVVDKLLALGLAKAGGGRL